MAALGAGYVIQPAGDLTRAKQSRAGNRLWLFKLPISCYSGQRMLRQLLGIVDAMCCTSVSRQLARLCTLTMLLPAQSSQLGPAAAWSGFRAASAGWLVVPRSNRACLDLLAHHESCGSSRQRNRYISDLSCLSASHVCVHWNPIAGFLFRKSHLIAASPLAGWLWPGSGRQLFLFWWEGAEQWLSKDEADFCRYDDVLRFRIRIRGGGLLPGGPHYLLLLLHPCPSALASDGFPPRLQYLDYPTTASPAITFILCLNISLVKAPSIFCQKTFSDMTTCCYFRPYAVLVSDSLQGSAIPNP